MRWLWAARSKRRETRILPGTIAPIPLDGRPVSGEPAGRAYEIDHGPVQIFVARIAGTAEDDRMPDGRRASPLPSEVGECGRDRAVGGVWPQAHVALQRDVHEKEADLEDLVGPVFLEVVWKVRKRKAGAWARP